MSNSAAFLSEVQDVLEDNILSYWLTLKDPRGGFYGQVSDSGSADKDAVRDVISRTGIIWSFSAAYRKFRKKEYLIAATHAKDFFLEHFIDHKYGGVYWSVDKDGVRVDTDAHLCAHALAISALSEFFKASRDDQAIKEAVNIFKIVRKQFKDETGRYAGILTRDFKPSGKEGCVSCVALIEAFANLYAVWPDKELKAALEEFVSVVCEEKPSEVSAVVLKSALVLKDFDIANRIRTIALKKGLPKEPSPDAIRECLAAWKYLGVNEGAELAVKYWQNFKSDIGHSGNVLFQTSRMCFEALDIFS